MLKELEIRSAGPWSGLARARDALVDTFPDLVIGTSPGPLPTAGPRIAARGSLVVVSSAAWRRRSFDPLAFDRAVAEATHGARPFTLRLEEDPVARGDLAATALQVVTRCQRHLQGRNRHSAIAIFDAILAGHRALHAAHDLQRPLVAADFAHALDTWRWVLRLDGEASTALQVAALFHDVERLTVESEIRIEQHAGDYPAFKRAHALAGAAITSDALKSVGAAAALVYRVAALVASHESPDDDPEKSILNEADALSFFSLNAPGFARYFGPAHTAKKVAYTLARLGARGRSALAGIRHRADIAALIGGAGGDRA
jgi:hypothetical protein